MKKWAQIFFAFAFPWVVLLLKDNPGGALLALVMQASLIGWIPASMWALRELRNQEKPPRKPEE